MIGADASSVRISTWDMGPGFIEKVSGRKGGGVLAKFLFQQSSAASEKPFCYSVLRCTAKLAPPFLDA
jgi:hypothetical protein